MSDNRKVEVFSARCSVCDDAVAKIRELACDSCDVIVLGCTELPLAITSDTSSLPLLDSTRLLAREAIRQSLERKT